jgi:hypothetical protein
MMDSGLDARGTGCITIQARYFSEAPTRCLWPTRRGPKSSTLGPKLQRFIICDDDLLPEERAALTVMESNLSTFEDLVASELFNNRHQINIYTQWDY